MAIVAEANKLEDPLDAFPVFRKFNNNGLEAQLFIKKAGQLDENTRQYAFYLTKRNMQVK